MQAVQRISSYLAGCGLLILTVLLIDPPTSIAPWGAKAHAGSVVLGGRRITCRHGKVVFNDKLPDLGMAARGTIWLNRKLLRKHSAAFQQFVFLHECAHQYTFDEAEADCWAVKRGVYRGIFNGKSINNICRIMKGWKGGLWHNAGPSRCAGIKQCFADAKKPRKKKSKRRSSFGANQ